MMRAAAPTPDAGRVSSPADRPGGPDAPSRDPDPLSVLDLAVGASVSAVAAAVAVGHRVGGVARPLGDALLRPPLLSSRLQPRSWLADLARRGSRRREKVLRDLSAVLDSLVPLVAQELLRRIDLTAVVRQYVDLDVLVAEVDLDGAAVRLDLDAIVRRLDLTRIVRERVDLDYLVGTVDLDTAAARLDVDAVARRLDLDAVIDRIDLAGLAREVIAEVDLPEIIRESTGSVASDTVRGVRMQSISADDALGRAVDRLRFRRGRGGGATPSLEAPRPGAGIPPEPEAGR